MGVKPTAPPLSLPHGRAAWPAVPWAACIVFSWYFYRPPTDLVALPMRLMAAWCFVVCKSRPSLWASSARRSRRCEPCRLMFVVVVVVVVHISARRRVLRLRPERSARAVPGSTSPRFTVLPKGPGAIVHSPGRRSGPTLPHREAKLSERGKLPMIRAALESWHFCAVRV